MCHSIAEVLLRALDTHKAPELGRAAGVSKYTIYRVANDEASLRDEQYLRISRYLAEHGDLSLARLALPGRFTVTEVLPAQTNGRIDDEVTDLVHACHHVVEGFRERDTERMQRGIEGIRGALAGMEAEKARLG